MMSKRSSRCLFCKCFIVQLPFPGVDPSALNPSTIHHAYEHIGSAATQPSICLPPPAIPSYLMSQQSSAAATAMNHLPKDTAPTVTPERPKRAKSLAPAKPKVDPEVVKQRCQQLEQDVLDVAPGTAEALRLFSDLPVQIAEVHPKIKDQQKFISDLCKTVWFK